ncbi:ATP-binding protein [Mycoplasma sp. AC157]
MKLDKYLGETTEYEKKEKIEKKDFYSWLKTVSAFANTNGGKIFFGIEDKSDKLVGLTDIYKDSDYISSVIKDVMEPLPSFDLKIYEEQDKKFIVLDVKKGQQTPYYLNKGGSYLAYRRIGNQSVVIKGNDLKTLILQGSNETWDSFKTNISYDVSSFSYLISFYYQITEHKLTLKDFKSFGLVSNDNYLNNSGALLADGQIVRHSRIFATRWNGLTKTHSLAEALDDEEFSGNLLYLLDSGIKFISRNSKNMWKKIDFGRKNYPDYPMKVIQEVLVNALIHRDYSIKGTEVTINIFDDRMEISSPGGMYNGKLIQEENIEEINSERRNPIIADLFSRLNLMERRGSGLLKIFDYYQKEENYSQKLKPEFKSDNRRFTVILKNLNYKQNIEGFEIEEYKENTKNLNFKIDYKQKNKNLIKPEINIETGDKFDKTPEINIETGDKFDKTPEINIETGDKIIKINKKEKQYQLIINYAKNKDFFKTNEIEKLLKVKYSRANEIITKMIEEKLLIKEGSNKNRIYKLNK